MRIIGIIAEYNPFHLGHLYHLKSAKNKSKAYATVAIMSGNFLQRGEPALIDKWARCKMALQNGIDLVLELPLVFSCRSAMRFASGGVFSLLATGIVTHLAFGAESNNLKELQTLANYLNQESPSFKDSLDHYLKKGYSFPHARNLALKKNIDSQSKNILNELNNPNNILALAYLRNLALIEKKIEPILIKRVGSYYAQKPEGQIASASAIRKLIEEKNSLWEKFVPCTSREILQTKFQAGEGPISLKAFEHNILAVIRRMSPQELKNIIEVTEGLENRIWELAQKNGTIEELIETLKTKRYTQTRIQRLLLHIYLNFTQDFSFTRPEYLRVLGFTNKGQELLKLMKTKATLPIITKLAKSYQELPKEAKKMLDLETRAGDLYNLAYPNPKKRQGRQDFYQSPIRVKE